MSEKSELTAEERKTLVAEARDARGNAYAPYSHYAVGAAIRTRAGKIYRGANVENAAYPVGLCAERVALFAAVAAGEREFDAIAVMTKDGASPCGACRQALSEFGLALEVIMADDKSWICQVSTLDKLLPSAFGKAEE
ncbi:MAG: cytidine deaminase [Anaerolineales bacterium]|nr:cytidine deaminase [Anaerolineales bacterium]